MIMLLSIYIISLPIYSENIRLSPHGESRISNISELCGCPCFDEAVGVGIYKIYNAVVILGVFVAYASALHDFILRQGKLNGLDTVALLIVSRKNDGVLLGIILALEYTMVHSLPLGLVCLNGVKH